MEHSPRSKGLEVYDNKPSSLVKFVGFSSLAGLFIGGGIGIAEHSVYAATTLTPAAEFMGVLASVSAIEAWQRLTSQSAE